MHRTSSAARSARAALPLALLALSAPFVPAPLRAQEPGVPEPGVPEPGVPEPGVPEPGVPEPERVPLVHLQTDLESYRLGETLWYRAHVGEDEVFPLTVQLVQPVPRGAPGQAQVLATQTLSSAKEVEGKVFLEPNWPGGRLQLRVRTKGGRLLHRLPVDVYDLDARPIGVRLRILGELFVPGETLTATVKATGPKGRPLANQTLQARAEFGATLVEAPVGPTDAEGWAVVRLQIPHEARGSGHLAVGLECKQGLGVAAAPVRVSAGVSRIDAFPEGGAIVTGHPQRLSLWARDLDGADAEVEGRILDDRGRTVTSFATDRYGHSLVEVPYAEGRLYRVAVDRPAMKRTFSLPGDTGHAASLRLERKEGRLEVAVRVREGERLERLEAHLGDRTRFTSRESLKKGLATFAEPRDRAPRFVYVVAGERLLLKAPVLIGKEHPFKVKVTLPKGQLPLPGRRIGLEVQTTWLGQPISADVALSVGHPGLRPRLTNFTARALLQPLVHRGLVLGGSDLLQGREANPERVQAFLLARGGYALPPGGVALGSAKGKKTPPDPSVGRALAPEVEARGPLQRGAEQTKRRRGALDALLARAHFLRAASPRQRSEVRARRRLPAKRLAQVPGLGKAAKRLPQDEKVSWKKADTRSSLCWLPRLKTDRMGRATVKLRIGHELARLAISAQGLARGAGAVSTTPLQPLSESIVDAAFPEGLALGDVVELWVEVKPRAGSRGRRAQRPYWLGLRLPPALEALDRTELRVDPRKDAPRVKFRVRARAEVEASELQLVLQRGAFEEVHSRPFSVRAAEPTLTFSRVGTTEGRALLQVSVPDNALPGSVKAESVLAPSRLSSAVEGLESLLREPHGCFEQTTSSNYPNLVLLSALRAQGADAAVLERAQDLAEKGFNRILSFQHPDGGFSLWGPKSGPKATAPHYTAMGAAQLARYAALHNGQGTHALERALAWLAKRKDMSPGQRRYVAFSLADAGRGEAVDAKAFAGPAPQDLYGKALLAAAMALAPNKAGDGRLEALLDELVRAQEPTGLIKGTGQSVMRSYGGGLDAEVTSLAAIAFQAGQRPGPAIAAQEALLEIRRPAGGWYGTQATALAIRALTRLAQPVGAPKASPVTFQATAPQESFRAQGLLVEGRHRPLAQRARLGGVAPGETVQLALSHRAGEALSYSLRCSYRVAEVRDAAEAPYALELRSPAAASVGGSAQVTLSLQRRPRTRPVEGQLLVQVALPAGLELTDLSAAAKATGAQRIERRGASWAFYFAQAPKEPRVSWSLEVRGVAQGHFKAGTSTVYPYYEPERIAFARARDLRVVGVGEPLPAGGGPAGQAGQASQATQATQGR